MEHKIISYFEGYPIYLSNRKNKKYMSFVNNRFVHFGDKRYEQYKDKIGYYKNLDHNDENRRKLYYIRHPKNYPKGSPDWLSKQILW